MTTAEHHLAAPPTVPGRGLAYCAGALALLLSMGANVMFGVVFDSVLLVIVGVATPLGVVLAVELWRFVRRVDGWGPAITGCAIAAIAALVLIAAAWSWRHTAIVLLDEFAGPGRNKVPTRDQIDGLDYGLCVVVALFPDALAVLSVLALGAEPGAGAARRTERAAKRGTAGGAPLEPAGTDSNAHSNAPAAPPEPLEAPLEPAAEPAPTTRPLAPRRRRRAPSPSTVAVRRRRNAPTRPPTPPTGPLPPGADDHPAPPDDDGPSQDGTKTDRARAFAEWSWRRGDDPLLSEVNGYVDSDNLVRRTVFEGWQAEYDADPTTPPRRARPGAALHVAR